MQWLDCLGSQYAGIGWLECQLMLGRNSDQKIYHSKMLTAEKATVYEIITAVMMSKMSFSSAIGNIRR